MVAGQKEDEEDKFNNESLSSLGQLSFCCQIKISVECCISIEFALIWLLDGEKGYSSRYKKKPSEGKFRHLGATKKSTKARGW